MRHMYQTLLSGFLRFWVTGVIIAIGYSSRKTLMVNLPIWVSRLLFVRRYRSIPIPVLMWQVLTFSMLIVNAIIIIIKPNIFPVVYTVFVYGTFFLPVPLFLHSSLQEEKKHK